METPEGLQTVRNPLESYTFQGDVAVGNAGLSRGVSPQYSMSCQPFIIGTPFGDKPTAIKKSGLHTYFVFRMFLMSLIIQCAMNGCLPSSVEQISCFFVNF